jgi:NADP-dependent 3-hydroxy acid dehydrogenase YdfG
MELANKVAIVTGASAGIGAAVAHSLSAAGCRLVLTARREDRLNELAQALPNKAVVVAADIAAEDTADRLLAAAVSHFGGADILVNNAGLLSIRPLENIDFKLVSKVLAVNLEAVIRLSYTFGAHFKERGGGAIINVSSIGAFMTVPLGGVYSAAKAGVESFTSALRLELAASGVKVGTIVPGSTETEILDVAREQGDQPWQQKIALLKAEDVAAGVLFMLQQPPQANIPRLHIYASEEIA